MKREIKFRGKRKDNKEWVEGDLQTNLVPKGSMRKCPAITTTKGTIGTFFINHETLVQFCGMRDKRKKEIYDGDILKDDYGRIYKVEYQECNAAFMLVCYNDRITDYIGYFDTEKCFEVIGNIYDNPELLEIKP